MNNKLFKNFIILLLFISTSVIADICNVSVYMPTTEKYLEELNQKFTEANCWDGAILHFDIGFADKKMIQAKYLLFQTQARYCDFDKTISFDQNGLNYNLVCSFKKN